MDRQSIRELLREVFGPNIVLENHPKWVGMHCVFAPWKHAGGRDKKPSAGISINDNGTSIYHCYGCGSKGPLEWFLKEWEKYSGENLGDLVRDAVDEEFFGGRLQEWGKKEGAKETLAEPLDKDIYLDLYDPAAGHPYLRFRGIKNSTADRLGLMIDPEDSEGDERILFPVFAANGDLHGFTGRAVHKGARLKVRDYHGLKKSQLLLGAHLIKTQPFIVVVEGLFDYAMMAQYGYGAVATMMAEMSEAQAEILKGFGKPVYTIYDNDEAGDKARESVKRWLIKHVPVLKTRYPKVKVRDRETGKTRLAQDPDELGPEHIANMLAEAKLM